MTDIGTVPVLIREDGHMHIIGRYRVARRHVGRALRRGLGMEIGHAHISAEDITRTADGRHITIHPVVTHITNQVGDTVVDYRDAA